VFVFISYYQTRIPSQVSLSPQISLSSQVALTIPSFIALPQEREKGASFVLPKLKCVWGIQCKINFAIGYSRTRNVIDDTIVYYASA
jgi:hypothetical protein